MGLLASKSDKTLKFGDINLRLLLILLFISILPVQASANDEDPIVQCHEDEYTNEDVAFCITGVFEDLETFRNKMEERTLSIVSSESYMSKLIYGVGENGKPIEIPKPTVNMSSNTHLSKTVIKIEDKKSREILKRRINDKHLREKRRQRLKAGLSKSRALFTKYRHMECSRRADSIIGSDKSEATIVFRTCQHELTNVRIEHLKESMRQSK